MVLGFLDCYQRDIFICKLVKLLSGAMAIDLSKKTTCINTYHAMGRFSRRQTDYIFPRKLDMTHHANCLLRRQFV